MKVRDLFDTDVERNIPPVVYFHEQSPGRLAAEVGEYIVTGGWRTTDAEHVRTSRGIHDEYVHLLTQLASWLQEPVGEPAAWISGLYGSGKSSFAKLLGLSLDCRQLPDGRGLAEAWLAQDRSPRAPELRQAWNALLARCDPMAVVFDIGGVARDKEHVHSVVLRQVQDRLGYCTEQAAVARYELMLERDGQYPAFLETAERVLGRPWDQARTGAMAEVDFSEAVHALDPARFPDPHAWLEAYQATGAKNPSVEDTVKDLGWMLSFRAPGKTLFIVMDEISQYIHQDEQRMLRLQSFASALGSALRGRAVMMALGQVKLEEASNTNVFGKLKERFPARFRVHLGNLNIRDVVHRRLLRKTEAGKAWLRGQHARHRAALALYAQGCPDNTAADAFAATYPLLPGHIDLLLELTSALRTRSTRAQGDDQAIRGLLQLLGELFRERQLADRPAGTLVTLDEIFEVQRTALDADVQETVDRILQWSRARDDGMAERVAKAVALLELIQETHPTTAELVSRCLYDRLDRGDQQQEVTDALERLRAAALLGHSERTGYKLQSTAGEEWERERRDITASWEQRSTQIQEALSHLVQESTRPVLRGRSFPWRALFSDHRGAHDKILHASREAAAVVLDLRMLARDETSATTWIKRSDEEAYAGRLVWLAGGLEGVREAAAGLHRTQRMIQRYEPRKASLSPEKKRLLLDEQTRLEEARDELRARVSQAWLQGRVYFQGGEHDPAQHGSSMATTLKGLGDALLPDLYPSYDATVITDGELAQLLERELSGPSPKFMPPALGLLDQELGRYTAPCNGPIPRQVRDRVHKLGGVNGQNLLSWFGAPPFGYHPSLVKACLAGLLRGGHLQVESSDGTTLTTIRDAGVRQVFERDRDFRQSTWLVAQSELDRKTLSQVCRMLKERLAVSNVDREPDAIADCVAEHFPELVDQLFGVLRQLERLPGDRVGTELAALQQALETALRKQRHTVACVKQVARDLTTYHDGVPRLQELAGSLTAGAVDAVRFAHGVSTHELAQLDAHDTLDDQVASAAGRLRDQLASPRPWVGIDGLTPDLARVREAYRGVRAQLLDRQGVLIDQAWSRVKASSGFTRLADDEAARVRAPLIGSAVDTQVEAVAPTLEALGEPVVAAVARGEQLAFEVLDRILAEKDQVPVVRVNVTRTLANRELQTLGELDAVLGELRERIAPELEGGDKKVRLV